MNVLVTGGAGFVGSHLVDRLLADGHRVVALDNLSTGRAENVTHWASDPRFALPVADVRDAAAVESHVARCDGVYHLAAAVGVRHIVADPLTGILVNVEGTANVLGAAFRYRRPVVFASSSEIYGKSARLPYCEDDDRVLGSTRVARWSYATAKALDEHLCLAYAAKGLRVAIVRYFNAYGPHPGGYASVVARFVGQALRGEQITVYGDASHTRSFVFVADTVDATVRAMETPGAAGEAINVGSEGETSVLDLARLVVRLAGSGSPIAHVPFEAAYGPHFEDVPRRCPQSTRQRECLGGGRRWPFPRGSRARSSGSGLLGRAAAWGEQSGR